MKTINIKGKEYVPVSERIKEFHKIHKEGYITSEIISNDSERVIIKATVTIFGKKESGMTYSRTFTGFSQASWKVGMMKEVALEVAETSAIGRALGFTDIGLIDGIATSDEMIKVSKSKGVIDQDKPPFGKGSENSGAPF